ncbi:MAG: DUF3326 domain-containing protein [Cyanobacteria bacterium]|nr:DUF3326 domain-containing protein [Cyanobacteriota bacterium]
MHKPFVAALIIPTGVQASVGGFAGDATPALNLLASVSDILITHPNVANAALFQKLPDNALYVEGYALDEFFKGNWGLQPSRHHKIGVVFDRGIDPEILVVHLNTLNAHQAVYGLDIMGYTLTDEPLVINCILNPASGSSTGTFQNPKALLKSCEKLLNAGATALALCGVIPDDVDSSAYEQGEGVDIIGGIEALLSHLVSQTFQVPCAHAPLFPQDCGLPDYQNVVDPRAAAEYLAPTFLPCVLQGLSKAPNWVDLQKHVLTQRGLQPTLTIDDVDAVVVPKNTLGGIPALTALHRKIPVVMVEENTTLMNCSPEALLGLSKHPHKELESYPEIFSVHTYLEAAGLIQALKLGLNLRPGGKQKPPVPCLDRQSQEALLKL